MKSRTQLSLLGELAIRELQDEARLERHLIDDDLPNAPESPLTNPQARRKSAHV